MKFKRYTQVLVLVACFACGVERGVPTDTLPLPPSEETLNKKKLIVDPAGYSTGVFTYNDAFGNGTVAVDAEGNLYSFMNIRYETGTGLELRPKAFKFLPNGTIDTSYNPVERYEDSVEDFNLETASAFVNTTKELYLLSSRRSGRGFDGATSGTSIVKFTSAGYVDSTFGVKGSVNSAEQGYTDIFASDQFLSIGGKSIRRFSLAGVIDKTFAGVGNLADADGDFAIAADQSVFLDNDRYDALGVRDESFTFLNSDFRVVGWDSTENGMVYFSDGEGTDEPELVVVNADGTLKTSFGDNGYVKLGWLLGTEFKEEIMNGNRILVYRRLFSDANFAEIEYTVFNSDGTRITTFGDPDTGLCKFQLNAIKNLALLPSGKVMITGTADSEFVIYHMGDTCVLVAVE